MSSVIANAVVKVGNVDKTDSKVVRIVHISDTHMNHEAYRTHLPPGDIIIHSGDFFQFSFTGFCSRKARLRERLIQEINSFFKGLPFKHKIIVLGNHEICFSEKDKTYLEENLTEVICLFDKSVKVEDINIYGTPWNARRWYSYARAFSKKMSHLQNAWQQIPETTDILVTHMPPNGILDVGSKKLAGLKNLFGGGDTVCEVCTRHHPIHEHWGCVNLRRTVLNTVR